MSRWLDLSGTSNLFKQIYVKGFVDISGGDFINRNGNLIIYKDTSLNRLFVSNDASFGGNLIVGKDLTILGRFAVQQYSNQNIINTTTTNYTFIVAEDMSLNGRLFIDGDTIFNSRIIVNNDISTNRLNGITSTTLGYLDPTSSIQTQLNNKVTLSTLLSNNNSWTGLNVFNYDVSLNNRLFVGNGITTKSLNGISSLILGYVDPTSSIQTQLNTKPSLSSVQSNNNTWTGSNVFSKDLSLNDRLFVTNIINNNISQKITIIDVPDFSSPIDIDCKYNSVFFIDLPTSNFSCNFTNLQSDLGKIFTVVLIINVGNSNRYYCNSAEINGDPYSLLSTSGLGNVNLGNGLLVKQTFSFVNVLEAPSYLLTDITSYQI
jgi:hypothetical protein